MWAREARVRPHRAAGAGNAATSLCPTSWFSPPRPRLAIRHPTYSARDAVLLSASAAVDTVLLMPQYLGVDHRDWERTCKFCGSRLDWFYSSEIAGFGMPEKDVIFTSVCTANCKTFARTGETGAKNK